MYNLENVVLVVGWGDLMILSTMKWRRTKPTRLTATIRFDGTVAHIASGSVVDTRLTRQTHNLQDTTTHYTLGTVSSF